MFIARASPKAERDMFPSRAMNIIWRRAATVAATWMCYYNSVAPTRPYSPEGLTTDGSVDNNHNLMSL